MVSPDLNALEVLVGGIAAPILYASRHQINVLTPFGAPSAGTVDIAVVRSGVPMGTFSATAAQATPGIFTQNGAGSGAGVIFNQDGSLNGPANPASLGSTLSIYVTGLGPLTPMPLDGFIPTTATSKPALPIKVGLHDSSITFPILYVGDVPQMV